MGIEIVPTDKKSNKAVKNGMELPVTIKDGKNTKKFTMTVQRCICNDANSQCESFQAAAPLTAQVRQHVMNCLQLLFRYSGL